MKTTVTTTKTVTAQEVIEHLEEHYGGKMVVGKPIMSNVTAGYQFRHQEKTNTEKQKKVDERLEWVADGRNCPPNREAFLAWADGKKLNRIEWGDTAYITDIVRDDQISSYIRATTHYKDDRAPFAMDSWLWEHSSWQEYVGED